MNVFRFVVIAWTFYYLGADAWTPALVWALVWAGVELGMAWTRWAERKERERLRQALHDLNGTDTTGG